MKKLFVGALAALCLAMAPNTYAKSINLLEINRVDGKKDKLKLHESLQIRAGEKGDILLVHPNITCSYPVADVKNFTFAEGTLDSDYSGDYELREEPEDGIAQPACTGVTISIRPDAIIVEGASESITLHSVSGLQAGQWPVAPRVQIPIASLAPGVYILRADSTTLKISL